MESSYKVLWTGGWDSTFRIIQLYRLRVTIQPIYILDQNRRSYVKEIEAIEKITKELSVKFPKSNGKILPIILKREDIPSDYFLKFVSKVLKRRMSLGKQYYWLACVAKKYKNLELSLHREDMDRFFTTEQLVQINDNTTGVNWKINPKKVDFYKRQLFLNMTFPLIEMSKPEMKRISEDDDFFDLMELTWFCHKSTRKPCGNCNPCKQYMRDGFGFRLE